VGSSPSRPPRAVLQPIARLLAEATGCQDQIDNDVQPRVEMTMPSMGEDRELIAQGSIDRADRRDLADTLMAVLES
jgi:hypothetical protein